MAEADELCERIAIVDRGRVLAIGTPGRAQAARPARVDLPDRARPARRRSDRARPAAGRRQRDRGHDRRRRRRPAPIRARPSRSTSSSTTTAPSAGSSARSAALGSRILALRKSEPTLEEVFVELVGRGFDDADGRRRRRGSARRHAGSRPATTARGPASPRPGGGRMSRPGVSVGRPTAGPRRGGRLEPAQDLSNDLRSVVGRAYPRVRGWPASRRGCSSRSSCRS